MAENNAEDIRFYLDLSAVQYAGARVTPVRLIKLTDKRAFIESSEGASYVPSLVPKDLIFEYEADAWAASFETLQGIVNVRAKALNDARTRLGEAQKRQSEARS